MPGTPQTIPLGLSWLPDGSALISGRDSFRLFPLTQDGTKKPAGKVPNIVTAGGEGGLLGIAVSPSWKTDRRVPVRDHGRAQNPDLAQDKKSRNGKLPRMAPDGKPPPATPSIPWPAPTATATRSTSPGPPKAACGRVNWATASTTQWPVKDASPSAVAYADGGAIYMAALRGERPLQIPVDGTRHQAPGTSAGVSMAYYTSAYGRLRTVGSLPGRYSLWLTATNADNNGDGRGGLRQGLPDRSEAARPSPVGLGWRDARTPGRRDGR
ncbi:PQQ-dependent sugar dehydrogenase [Streptomyces chattanoogensis]|uniref:PQQ-dependent sugar dehydrogenase n=1 Tax=Streptomyces chattanoogensis TaxID=66876 RepID=UPI00368E0F34